ncbi:MAG: hypothetical protein KGI83_03900 [Verrucomicrobiota bacterium]|nr:hypothetical protein [Verrucomicrobiota bacterium]
MFFRQAIASALHLFVVLAFFLAGLFCVSLPRLPLTRMNLVEMLSHQPEQCTQIGMGLFLAALIFLIGFYALDRGKYLVIRMGLATDLKIVQHAIEECFAKQFQKKIALKEVTLGSKSHLHLNVHLAPMDESSREDLFITVEKQLSLLLHQRFGYSKPFHLVVKI